jgi:hypothetical protein
MYQSKAVSIIIWLICVGAWGYGVLQMPQPTTIVVSELSDVATEYSFQYPEQWDDYIPFRWSQGTATLALAPLPSTHVIVDIYAVGHQPQQAFTLTISGAHSQHLQTVEQRFRHYRVLFMQPVSWIPTMQPPQLVMRTETATQGERTLGMATAHITTETIRQRDAQWWWDVLWVAFTLWMCGIWGRRSWQAYHWMILVGITALLMFIEWLAVPSGYMRSTQIIGILLCQDYQRYSIRLQNGWNRLYHWLTATTEGDSPIHPVLTQWFNVCGLANIATNIVVRLRAGDSAEFWDRLLYLAPFTVAVLYMSTRRLEMRWRPNAFLRTIWQGGLTLSWVILLWQGFQPEALRPGVIPRFAGFDHWVLLITVVIAVLLHWSHHRAVQHVWTRWMLRVVATWLVVVATSTLWQGNDQYHNLFIMNEVLAPVSQRTAGHDFIPHYSIVFSLIPQLLLPWQHQLGAAQFVDIVFYSLKICGMALVVLVIRTVARMFPRADYATAILFVLPVIALSAYPWWNPVSASTPIMDFLAYIPVRLFSIMIPVVVIGIGIVAGFGMFNNSDFGVFAAAALGITLVISPTQPLWAQRMKTGAWYTIGIIGGYIIIALAYLLLQKPLTLEHLFWFQRQYGAGFGALMIRSPGPGVFFIVVAVSLWVVICTALLDTPTLRSWIVADRLRIRIITLTVYFASCAAFGLVYYLNRSSAAGQLSMSFIPFWLAGIGVWRLLSLTPNRRGVAHTAFHVFIALPIALSISFFHIPRWPPTFDTFSREIYREQQESRSASSAPDDDARSVWPFIAAQHSATYLRDRGLRVAYFGPWAHIFAVYTDIPSSLLFNRPVDGNVSAFSKRQLCANIAANHYNALVLPDITANTTHLCRDFVLVTSPHLPLNVAIAHAWMVAQPHAWDTLRTQLDVCAENPRRFVPCR